MIGGQLIIEISYSQKQILIKHAKQKIMLNYWRRKSLGIHGII